MKRTALVLVPILGALGLLAASGSAGSGAATAAPAKGAELRSFRSCADLLGYVKQQSLPLVQPWGLGPSVGTGAVPGRATAPSAAQAGDGAAAAPDYSTTNVQEPGVDEPDIVKTNGSYIFTVSRGTVDAVDVRGSKPVLVDSLTLGSGGSELLLYGDRLIVLSRGTGWVEPLPAAARIIAPIRPSPSALTEIDVSDPSAMKIVRTLTLDGSSYVSARLVGSTARVVASSPMPRLLDFGRPPATPQTDAQAVARNRSVIASSRISSWLPTYTLTQRGAKARPARALVQCRHVLRPAEFSGLGMLTVLTIDLSKGLEPVDSDAILTDGRIVYASADNLYVATERWAERPLPARPTIAPANVTTAIHQFDISDPSKTDYRGSGEVPGFLLNQWSLSEDGGVLRIASTEAPAWWDGSPPESQSYVSVLRNEGGKLVTVGKIGDLGRGERIYAVRFIGDVGYVVTFRQIDPLYTLDLSQPEHPTVLGELELQGYSAYLHPVGENLLLGVGQDANGEGRVLGSELSLFDVSNPRKPVRLFQKVIGPGNSEAEYDHHAFLYWPKTSFVAVPVQTYSAQPGVPEAPFVGAIGFHVGRQSGIQELGRITHPGGDSAVQPGTAYPIRRSVVVGGVLYTVSDLGVRANSLASLADLGWAGFPQPTPVPVPEPGAIGAAAAGPALR